MAKTLINLGTQAQGRVLTLGTETSLPSSLFLHKGDSDTDAILLDSKGSINVDGNVFIAQAPTTDLHATNKFYVDSLIGNAIAAAGYQRAISFSGAINGVNQNFTISSGDMSVGSLQVYLNGMLQAENGDYTLAGNTISFSYAPSSDDVIIMYATIPSEGGSPVGSGGSGAAGNSYSPELINVTFNELYDHILYGTLTVGGLYKITDYQTKHIIPNSTHLNVQGTVYVNKLDEPNDLSEGVEPLIVMALTSNSLAKEAHSELFPRDTIHFDVHSRYCEDGVTLRKGKITYRKDNSRNIELHYDWRNVRFIRYKLNPSAYSSSTTYGVNSVVIHDNAVYVCLSANTIGITPAHSYTNYNWAQLYAKNPGLNAFNLHIGHLATANLLGRFSCAVDSASYRHVWTFNSVLDISNETVTNAASNQSLRNVSIGFTANNNGYNNIVYIAATNTGFQFREVIFGNNCINNTFLRQGTDLRFGEDCNNNLFTNVIAKASINSGSNNIFMEGGEFSHSFFSAGTNFSGNLFFGLGYSTIADNVYNNIFKRTTRFTTLTQSFNSNTVHNNFNSSVVSHSICSGSVYRGAVEQLSAVSRIMNTTFMSTITRTLVSVEISNRTITNAHSDVNISLKSATKLFYATIDDNGVPTYIAVV
jgi:hypothetical protein